MLDVADVLDLRPARHFALWHHRAVFHFLTDKLPVATPAHPSSDAGIRRRAHRVSLSAAGFSRG